MIKFFSMLIMLAILTLSSEGQDTLFHRLPAAIQKTMKQISSKYKTIPIDPSAIRSELEKSGFDFSKMAVEDAIMLMYQLISDDARNDMKEFFRAMDATRLKRSAMREAEARMKENMKSMKDSARRAYDKLGRDSINLVQRIRATEIHIKAVDDAIMKMRKTGHG